ncbi:hypothetical protein FHP25_14715 [Vineibacter terrae]|uniref:Uncharacterized protein n=1 Tax=Vineibacter terrae TaxID=2586908 RepID=A0A5C8PLP9_9HYPH|nr:hypothetical protein [Vineibacter terrae]TXL75134.1 hypothetical protein FHP25_14715 [Vineibacter terrae]
MTHPSVQLGFEALLASAEASNHAREQERATAHLPSSMLEGIPYYRLLIRQHHAAMLAADVDEAMRLRVEAALLARRLNGGETGILADDDAPGCVLARETSAEIGTVPLWGQEGEFIVTVGAMRVRIELKGMFCIGSRVSFWPGFAAHAVDMDRPYLSETGYRSFLGIHADPVPGLLPDEFVSKVIAAHVAGELKGRLLAIKPLRKREEGA